MVGHKFSMEELAQDLEADRVNYTTTEFCQGRVTRWGVAWTYNDYDLSVLGMFFSRSSSNLFYILHCSHIFLSQMK